MKPLDHQLMFSADPELEELTRQALTTPSLDAANAAIVLADALVEKGYIKPPKRHGSGRQKERSARAMVVKMALHWAMAQRWLPKWWNEKQTLTSKYSVTAGEAVFVPRAGRIKSIKFSQNGRVTSLPGSAFGATISIRKANGEPVVGYDLNPGDVLRLQSVSPTIDQQAFLVEVESK